MDDYRPSRFDRMLAQADRLLRRGFALITGDEPIDFDQRQRLQAMVPVRVESHRRRKAPARRTHIRLL